MWTNDPATSDPILAACASTLTLADDIDELLDALATRHPRELAPRVARSCAIAAAIALGDIAHRLWQDREPTSPQLALARFADLSARIDVAPDAIAVRIPRGARHRDLERAGFLGTYRAPWLGDCTVTIGVQ
jgi:hypothetical protein